MTRWTARFFQRWTDWRFHRFYCYHEGDKLSFGGWRWGLTTKREVL